MAEITAALVKELRDITGAGMMACKKALTETAGDMDKAVEFLREKGLAKAAKKAGRIAAEGLVRLAFSADHREAVVVEVNSETDFVSKNPEFVQFVEDVAAKALEQKNNDIEEFMNVDFDGEGTLQNALSSKIAKIGENMNIRRFFKCATPGVVYTGYIHGGGRIGVLVGIETEATFEEIEAAAKEAYADSFIKRLPKGYDTIVSEVGYNLSAVQRQLLCIARIMLVLPPMLILDEATSSIDTMTEARISKAFDKMMTGRTSFVVAHRLSTIKNADMILVLKDGHIIEQGNHKELMEMKGFYYDLNNAV